MGDSASEDPPEPEYVPTGEPVEGADGMPSIKDKFGVTLEGKAGVTAAFLELSAYIKGGGLSSDENVICLGDWIDLEDGLTVDAYNGAGEFAASNTEIDLGDFGAGFMQTLGITQAFLDAYEGKLLRLIAVGINSFHSNRGVKTGNAPTVNGDEEEGRYAETANDGTPHVVFHFQNLPVRCRMNETDTNEGGYPGSEMRKYLTRVEGDGESGKFLAGLKNAGVPEEALWAPARIMSGANTGETVRDLLWLPTLWEIRGGEAHFPSDWPLNSPPYETAENQARLEYYLNNSVETRLKGSDVAYESDPGYWSYWLASSFSSETYNTFWIVDVVGRAMGFRASFSEFPPYASALPHSASSRTRLLKSRPLAGRGVRFQTETRLFR